MNNTIYTCEYCGNPHNGTYGSGRFCCASCARQYSNQFVTNKGRANQIKALSTYINKQKILNSSNKKYQISNISVKAHDSDMHNTPRNGKIAELETIKRFSQRGIPVYIPIIDEGIDMLADFNGKIHKIQVKSTTVSNSEKAQFSLTRSKNRIANGPSTKEQQRYSKDEVDYFSLYDIPNDELFLLKNDGIRSGIYMRYLETKSGQKDKINRAEDYQFDTVLDKLLMGTDPDDIIDANYEVLDDDI